MKWFLLMSLAMTAVAQASTVQMINALGASPKGQFVAIEEYGYNPSLKTYYSRIKLMNTWKNSYVAPPFEIERGARRPSDLHDVRQEARAHAAEEMAKYNIETST
jgi:predicted secreted protein